MCAQDTGSSSKATMFPDFEPYAKVHVFPIENRSVIVIAFLDVPFYSHRFN